MLAATITGVDATDPLSCLHVGEHPDPEPEEGWSLVRVRAASINHHDLWALRGVVGLKDAPFPRVLGSDAAGTDDAGREVIVHALVNDPAWEGEEVLDPRVSMLSDWYDGTLAECVAVPPRNLIPKPEALSFEEAACLSTAWLTAYRMLFVLAEATRGTTVLVQGAGGGLATATTMLGRAAGVRVWVTSRSEEKRARAVERGAGAAVEPGGRLPMRVDAVLETVGRATWDHSLKSLRPGGTVVVAGATSGPDPSADLARMFWRQLSVVGSSMGTISEFHRLCAFLERRGVRPLIDSEHALADAQTALSRLESGTEFGKIVVVP